LLHNRRLAPALADPAVWELGPFDKADSL